MFTQQTMTSPILFATPLFPSNLHTSSPTRACSRSIVPHRTALLPLRCTLQSQDSQSLEQVKQIDPVEESLSVVREFWDFTLRGEFSKTIHLFTSDAVYADMINSQPWRGIRDIRDKMTKMEGAFPAEKFTFILDDPPFGSMDSVAVRWRVRTRSGRDLPFSTGVSVYKLVRVDGKPLISEVYDYPEPALKIGSGVAGNILRVLSVFL